MRAAWPFLLACALAVPLGLAENIVHNTALGVPDNQVVVAVLDTGIDPTHPEFAADQIVAWWDFSVAPFGAGAWQSGQTPHDHNGHGTGTASLVGGATVGAYPGVKLAIGKVERDSDGAIVNLPQAIRWAADVVGADVISISIGPVVPEPGLLEASDEATASATRQGALVVASAGNGIEGAGVKFPSEMHAPASEPVALDVGAVGFNGRWTHTDTLVFSFYSNTNPDAVAWGTFACMARGAGTTLASVDGSCKSGNSRYGIASGTSFATPLTAGWAAKIMQAAIAAGQDASPARVKSLVLGTARDDAAVPYALEGRGFVNGFTTANYAACTQFCNFDGVPDTVAAAIALAQSGGAPPAPGLEAGASAAASNEFRQASMRTADRSLVWASFPHGSNGERRLNASAAGVRDSERWTLDLVRGDRVSLWVNATDGQALLNDADLFLFAPSETPTGSPAFYDLEAASATSERTTDNGFTKEHIVGFVATESGTHTLVVHATAARQNGIAYSIVVRVNGALVAPTFAGDATDVVVRGIAQAAGLA